MGSIARAGAAAASSAAAASNSANTLLDMAQSHRRRRAPGTLERLRIERGNRQEIIPEVLAGDLANLLGRDLAQLLQLQVLRPVRDARGFERGNLARLNAARSET